MIKETNKTVYVIQEFTTWFNENVPSWHDMYKYNNLSTANEANKWIKKLRRKSFLEKDMKEYRILERTILTRIEIIDNQIEL